MDECSMDQCDSNLHCQRSLVGDWEMGAVLQADQGGSVDWLELQAHLCGDVLCEELAMGSVVTETINVLWLGAGDAGQGH
jgi:hypothetical protein